MDINPEELAKRIAGAFGASIASPIRGTIIINSDGTNPANVDEVGLFYVYVKLLNQPEIVTAEYDPNAISYSVLADGSPVLVQLKETGGYKLIGADMAIVNTDPSLYGGPSVYDFQHDHTESTLPLGTNSVTTSSITASAVTTAKIADANVTNAKLAGTITVALGGTGRATLTANNLLAGNGTGTVNLIAPSTSGNILQSNGTSWASVAPSFNASVITAGTLSVARGGTGLGTLTANNVILGNGTSTPLFVAPSTSGNVLTSNGTTWVSQAPSGISGITLTSNNLTVTGSGTASLSVDVPDVFSHTDSLDNGYWENDAQNGFFDFRSNSPPQFSVSRFRNLFSTKTAVLNADVLGQFAYTGFNSSAFIESSIIRATATDNFSVGDTPSKLEFLTTADNTSTPALALTLNSDKSAVFAGALSGITSLSASGNISSSAGSVSANTTVSAGTTITAGTGLTVTTGNLGVSAGTISASGNISSSAGALSANTTVTAGTGITATTGNISASSGNLSASGSVSASSASITGNVTADIFIADTTVGTNTGGIGYNSTSKHMNTYTAGIEGVITKRLFALTSTSTIASTAVETAFTLTGNGATTLPANFYTVGKSIRIRASGYFSTTGTPTVRLRLYYGATVVINTVNLTTSSGVANRVWVFEGTVDCYSTGVSGTVWGQGQSTFESLQSLGANNAAVTIDTTASQAITLQWTWGTSSPSNTATLTNFRIFEE